MPKAEVTIRNRKGLHARAAAKFVKLAAQYESGITVSRGDQEVSGLSILGLMMLAASPGCTITVSAEGADQDNALGELVKLVDRGFDEED